MIRQKYSIDEEDDSLEDYSRYKDSDYVAISLH